MQLLFNAMGDYSLNNIQHPKMELSLDIMGHRLFGRNIHGPLFPEHKLQQQGG